ncbi:MAG: putative serine/threonine protein kinase [Streblomastix strix]|uniref:Putative serine/threonine protein kinase n=1 Tax=Streblomastix strix TaxID=222440 RepID=A0A5J4UW00_9EUKA|nr:MAG: putative serine/threonine protein kinase [Streblomastix strix]
MDFEDILRRERQIPIRPLGAGYVYQAYNLEDGMVAIKIMKKEKFSQRELDSSINLYKHFIFKTKGNHNQFILRYHFYQSQREYPIFITDYANMKTLEVIVRQQQMKPLPNYALRTLFKQILEGIRVFHSAGLVHRDIKCDNILLHCPPGSGRVYAKLSDFGFAKKEDLEGGNTYSVGTYPFMAPELFQIPVISTQKVDIYAVGITFYRLLTNDYPIKGNIPDDYFRKMTQQMYIKRPPGITDDHLWNLISQMLDFNPDRRITATEALKHEYFTSSEAISDISPEQQELATKATELKEKGDKTISEYDINPTFIMPETVISNYFPKDELEELIQNNKENKTPKLKVKLIVKMNNKLMTVKL